MKLRLISATLVAVFCAVFVAWGGSQDKAPPPMRLEAQLVWGTNDKSSPNDKHTPVRPEVKKKLEDLPLKWSHYFEVSKQRFDVAPSSSTKVTLSKQCSIEVKNLGNSRIEVSHFGKGEHTLRRMQKLPKGETFVLGGNAPNATSWFVLLKRVD